MSDRLKKLGFVLALFGLAFMIGGGYAFMKVQEGSKSLNAFSAAQGVELSYNEEGQLVDRGEVAGAQAIMSLLLTYEPVFLRFGYTLFISFATILIAWHGIKMMFAHDGLGVGG